MKKLWLLAVLIMPAQLIHATQVQQATTANAITPKHETIELGSVELYLGEPRADVLARLVTASYTTRSSNGDGKSFLVEIQNHAQEVKHAPTVAQCRADQKSLFAKLEAPNGVGVANVSYDELEGWGYEMSDCIAVDPEFTKEYYNTLAEAATGQLIRMERFLDRHNLWGQFGAEDAQGKGH
jgi:hypothetical protein